MKKIVILNIIALTLIGMFVFFTNQGSITGRVIPSSLSVGENEPDILETCSNKKFDSSGFFGCYINGTIWKCELTGEEFVDIVQTTGSSMYPTITEDTFAILKETSFEDLEICDIVGYRKQGKLLLHRIVEKDNANKCVTTKGDNNQYTDGCIKEDQIIGKVALLLEGAEYNAKLTDSIS